MASFQSKFNTDVAYAIPGTLHNPEFAETSQKYMSDGTLMPGRFAFQDTADKQLACLKKTGGKLLGMVLYTKSGYFVPPLEGNSTAYKKFCNVSIITRGAVNFILPESASGVTDGQSILCDPATGDITFGEAGTANDTGWVVEFFNNHDGSTAKAGDFVIAKCFGLDKKLA